MTLEELKKLIADDEGETEDVGKSAGQRSEMVRTHLV